MISNCDRKARSAYCETKMKPPTKASEKAQKQIDRCLHCTKPYCDGECFRREREGRAK